MGHRLVFNNAPQVSETDRDQGWNHGEQPYMPIARGISESSVLHPPDNIAAQGVHFPTQWTPAPRSSGYSSSIYNGELPQYQPMAPGLGPGPGPSHDPFLHQSAPGNIHMLQDNYLHRPSSSNIGGQTAPVVDDSFYNQAMGSGRGPYKRKSPGIPPICERGSTSRYYDVGSSSDIRLPANPWPEKQNNEPYRAQWEYQPNYGVNGISIGGEGTPVRNVRSRAAVDRETNLARTHISSNTLHHSSSRSTSQCNSVDFWGPNANAQTEWNGNVISPAAHGVASGSDPSFFSDDPNSLNMPNNHPNSSLEIGAYNSVVSSNRNQGPNTVNSHGNQSFRGVQSGYGHRSAHTFRASSSNFRPGHAASSDEGQQMVSESHPSRHPRVYPSIRFHSSDRNGRSLPRSDRYRPYNTEDESLRERWTQESLTVVDHSHPPFNGSRAMLDHYRDMRLDIDNMGYEELLALGERIGSVSTGLSDGLISKCLTESIYCSSDLLQDEGTCVICLEEYKNMDDVGTLKVCGHDFHVGCIRKWLSMKNVCPICKSPAMDEKMKEK